MRAHVQGSLGRFAAFALVGVFALSACGSSGATSATPAAGGAASTSAAGGAAGEPITIGVSGPLTGDNAQYGAQWKKGFDLALEEINGAGGIDGRPLQYQFEDSQSDPKQSVVVAQKFVADDKIVVELGDFSSTASMAASQIYQRAGLVQFGFTNSHPDFTKGGDYMWSNSPTQNDTAPLHADFAAALGLKKVAVLRLNTDWGKATYDLLEPRLKALGIEVSDVEAYLADEKDFRSALTRVRDSNPDGILLISYYTDAALIVRQIRDLGLNLPIVANSSNHSPKFIELGGAAVNGVYVASNFSADDPRPEVQTFVKKYEAKYNEVPDYFTTHAYDTLNLIAAAIKLGGPTRQGVHDALPKLKAVPSVVYGTVTFNTETRRVDNPKDVRLIVQDGKFVVWDGKAASK